MGIFENLSENVERNVEKLQHLEDKIFDIESEVEDLKDKDNYGEEALSIVEEFESRIDDHGCRLDELENDNSSLDDLAMTFSVEINDVAERMSDEVLELEQKCDDLECDIESVRDRICHLEESKVLFTEAQMHIIKGVLENYISEEGVKCNDLNKDLYKLADRDVAGILKKLAGTKV